MNEIERFDELQSLIHQRKLSDGEVEEVSKLALALQRPNPLLPATASIVAKIVVVNEQGQVLVLWRSDKTPMPGRVDLPGGGVDFGEDPAEGVVREAREEAGVSVNNIRIVEAYGFILQDKYYLMLGYVGLVESSEVKLSWEHDRYAWMDLEEVLSLDGWQERHLRILTSAKSVLNLSNRLR